MRGDRSMERLPKESTNIVDENIRKIQELFPTAVTEAKDKDGKTILSVDFAALSQELSKNLIGDGKERYQTTWPDKRKAVVIANTPSTKALRPLLNKSINFDSTENIYIEGDNLDALKILREAYLAKVKMIYIDPPYNTGHDFIYPDNFAKPRDEYLNQTDYFDENGNKMQANLETNGRFHTDWLNMIFPRLKLARDLLAENGAIFISIDENELGNLIKVCDEIFGERNRISIICNKARASISNDKIISQSSNFILFYAKNIDYLFELRKRIGLGPNLEGFNFDDNDGKGPYRLVPVDGPGGARKGNPYYEFHGVEGYFRFSKSTMEQMFEENLIVKKGNSIYQKYYLSKAKETRKTATDWWDDVGLTSSATAKLKDLMGGAFFDNPKPVELISKMLLMITFDDKEATIMDFFSGSATTAHAVMKMNAEDGGKRKFIMVQIPEICDKESDAYKAGFKNICEIGEKRIVKAANKIRNEQPLESSICDFGMRVFAIDSSNFKDIIQSPAEYTLEGKEDNIKEDRSDLDLVFQCILDLGFTLSVLIEKRRFKTGKGLFYSINNGDLLCCFTQNVDEKEFEEMASLRPLFVVFRDSSFSDDSASVNCEQIFKTLSPKTKLRIL